MKHKSVVRNEAYRGGEFNVRERHNERNNESYHNGDIVPERAPLNIHFRRNLRADGSPETYEETFNRLLENGTIVKRGLREDAKLFDEMVFDVNTEFFEDNGGYDYAKRFFEETYRLAVNEIGGEDFLDFKIQQDKKRLGALDEQAGRKKVEVDKLTEATKVRADISATQTEIDAMARPGKSGNNVIVAKADWETVSAMAKRCVILDAKLKDTQRQIDALRRECDKWKTNYERLWNEVKSFIHAIRRIPQKLLSFISEHLPKTHSQEV